MLEVLDVILVLKSFSAFVALVISVVMLAVFEAINVGNVVIVDEITPPTLFTVGKSAVPPKSFVNLKTPFTVEDASAAPEPPTNVETNSVVAICVVLVPGAAVGAVGVPVKDGDAIVARNNISAILVVMLAVFEVTLVSNAASAFVALVISAVILAVLEVILVSNAASALVALVISAVILAVFEAIAAVFAVILEVFEVILVSNAASALVALVISAVILEVLDVILVLKAASAFVALVISAVILDVFAAIAFVFVVMLDVLALTLFVNTNSAA
jgi:hypothetical protein